MCSVDPGDTGVAITGNLVANDAVQFSDDIDDASGAYGLDVYSSTLAVAPMESPFQINCTWKTFSTAARLS